MTRLSVNINKIATLRNARGGDVPNLLQAALRSEKYGAQGITVHPRPDERHIRYSDVRELAPHLKTEFNIEGYPSGAFMDLVLEVKPAQVTLVPDAPDVLTSNAGWDTRQQGDLLRPVLEKLRQAGIRSSLFIECDEDLIRIAAELGSDRVELYTEAYAHTYPQDPAGAVADYSRAAEAAHRHGLGVNAGHDLNLDNLAWFAREVPYLEEVSIGHALIADALYLGLENSIQQYRLQLDKAARP